MENRFKFRAWSKSENKMISYQELKSISYLIGDSSVIDSGVFYPFEASNMKFMQCTGLTDKNGNLIYEGDVVKDDTNIAIVKSGIYTANNNKSYSNEETYGYYLEYISHSGIIDHSSNVEYWEIIGNLYENTELLQPNSQDLKFYRL